MKSKKDKEEGKEDLDILHKIYPNNIQLLHMLQRELKYAIKKQFFKRASILKEEIKRLKPLIKPKESLASLQEKLKNLIELEQYEEAKEIRNKINKLK